MDEQRKTPEEKTKDRESKSDKISFRTALYILIGLLVLSLTFFLSMRYISIRSGSEIESFRKLNDQQEYTTVSAGDGIERIDINNADLSSLTELPGIGNTRAAAIIEYRETYGAISTPEDLLKIEGIGEGTLEKILPYIVFSEENGSN